MADDPYRYFRIEARELLDQLGQGALDLEKGAAPELVSRLLRLAHTLKGAARVVKQPEIAERAHAVEDALAVVRDSSEPVSRARIDVLLTLLDEASSRVGALSAPAQQIQSAVVPTEEVFRALRPDLHELDVLLNGIAEAHAQLAAIRPRIDRVQRARYLADLVLDQLASPAAREGVRRDGQAADHRALPVAVELAAILDTFERDLASGLDQAERELREVRHAAERLQLIPTSALFTLLERTARDSALRLGKAVVFDGRGGDVRVDAQVLAVVQSALLQLVRNAVAHGVELPADRRAHGKAPAGHVRLEVVRRGRFAAFRCVDDGGGVDLEGVRHGLREKGMPAAEAAALSSDALLRILLKGGLSTSRTVTDTSGRGVGMDVVREAAERLGGEVDIRTEVGLGTTIELRVPLSLASFEALAVEVSGTTALIPFDAVRGSLRISPDAITRTAHQRSIQHDGATIPLGSLARAIAPQNPASAATGPATAVVVQGPTSRAAFGVDRILGTATIVLRPLPPMAPAADFIAGASLDVEGVPRLVLEPDGLVAAVERELGLEREAHHVRRSILVVDDSLTTRMLEQSILESAGYEVGIAASGEEALEKARGGQYALFLVDIEMPGMDGFAFIERARADPNLRDVPSILVSSRSSSDDRRRGQEVGAQAYIVKSEFDQGVLLDRIKRLVA